MKLISQRRSPIPAVATLSIAIATVSSAVAIASLALEPASAYRPLSSREVKAFQNLRYPQSGRAIYNRFGRPLSSDGFSDWYPMHSGGMVQVSYVGNRAQYSRVHP